MVRRIAAAADDDGQLSASRQPEMLVGADKIGESWLGSARLGSCRTSFNPLPIFISIGQVIRLPVSWPASGELTMFYGPSLSRAKRRWQ